MRSFTAPEFWKLYRALPMRVRRLARKNFALWKENPRHPSLRFKQIGPDTWSARVGDNYRAVAASVPEGFIWYWIGAHKKYERLIASL